MQFEKNYSPHTLESYEKDLIKFEGFIAPLSLLEADSVSIRHWMVMLMDEGYLPTSVNRKLSSLKSFYRYLCKNNHLSASPVKNIVGPKANKPLPYFVKDKEMDNLFQNLSLDESFEGVRDKAVLDTFYTTGVRCAELAGIKEEDIDFDAGWIRVIGKRNKQRIIPFSDTLKESLGKYKEMRNEQAECLSSFFFVRADGRPLTNSIIYGIVNKHLAGVPNLSKRSPHVLRHTFATSMLNNGADLSAVKELLGHASLASTEVYTHTTFEELKKTYNQAHPRA